MEASPVIRFAKRSYAILKKTLQEYSFDQIFLHAAALGFYTLFSLAPILIIAVAVTGLVFGEEAARGELRLQMEDMLGAESAEAVESAVALSRPEGSGLISTAMGLGLLLIGATTVFHQLQRSLNTIWSVVAKPSSSGVFLFLKSRLLSLALVVTIGFLLLVSLVMSTAVSAFIRYGEKWVTAISDGAGSAIFPLPYVLFKGTDLAITLTVFSVLFGMIFKILPDVHLRWRDVWKGAILTAFLFMVGEFFISLYLSHFGPASTYGAAGSMIAVILWVYYSSLILLFGAEFVKVSYQFDGRIVEIKSTAARLRRQIIEEDE